MGRAGSTAERNMCQTCCRGNDTLRSVEAPTKLEPSLVTESLKTMISLAQFLEEASTVPAVVQDPPTYAINNGNQNQVRQVFETSHSHKDNENCLFEKLILSGERELRLDLQYCEAC